MGLEISLRPTLLPLAPHLSPLNPNRSLDPSFCILCVLNERQGLPASRLVGPNDRVLALGFGSSLVLHSSKYFRKNDSVLYFHVATIAPVLCCLEMTKPFSRGFHN